jgi:tRNA synthetases class I (I, L, M and V)./Anticodon-binding domain.
MAVPAHDERDYMFAKKYDLPMKRVIKGRDGVDDSLPFVEYGILVDSGDFTGSKSEDARIEIVKMLEKEGKGSLKVNYRLRDWLVSRQRYWGAPIPIIHCEKCGLVPVPEEDLPVLLPYNVEFSPDGESPLKKSEEFMNTTCPKCGGKALRDPDTLDTFVDSSWYFLRYPDNKNDKEPFNKDLIDKMLPVDKYIGGAEHACMHLLYARFVTKALRDLGYLDFDEPFKSLIHQGIILGPDGNKMSKSRGNTISPDEYINEYGSDVFRMYLMFGFAFTEGGPWNDDGIKAMSRFISRIERLVDKFIQEKDKQGKDAFDNEEKELNYVRNYTIKSVTDDAEKFQFNTAIARIMELVNALYKYDGEVENKNMKLYEETIADLIRVLAPFAPHFSEEMWERMGYSYSVFNQKWPEYDDKALVKDTIEIAIQVNGKVRGRLEIPSGATEKEIQDKALVVESIKQFIEGKEIKKVVVVKNRLVNIVVK